MLRKTLFCFFLLFSLNICSAVAHAAKPLDHILAVIDSSVILHSDFLEFKAIAEYQRRQQPQSPPLQSDAELLDALIMRTIQLNRAKQTGIRVSDNQLNELLAQDLRSQGIDPENIIEEVADFPNGVQSFRRFFRDNLIIHEFQSIAIRSSTTVTDLEARSFLVSEQGRDNSRLVYELAFLSMPNEVLKMPENNKALEEVALFFRESVDFSQQLAEIQKNYPWVQGKRLASRLVGDLPTVFSHIVPLMSEQEVFRPIFEDDVTYLLKVLSIGGVEPQYQDMVYARHILLQPSVIRNDLQTKLQIAEIRQKISNGEPFGNVARTFTEDSATKNTGGNLGWKPYNSYTPIFSEMVRSLPLLDISEPFRSPFGWHIAQVLERKKEDISERLELDTIKNHLFQQKINDELPRWLSQLRETSYIDIRDPEFVLLESATQ